MRPIAIDNPPNPWESSFVEYLGEPPVAALQIFEDHSRSILSKNDSPDVGFTWSVNPYRGCMHACAYCLSGDTPILMGDGSTKNLAEIRAGDEVYGTVRNGSHRRYARTRVLQVWGVHKPGFRITLEDGTKLVSSGDHRFLTRRGWKYVVDKHANGAQRPHLTPNDKMMGTGRFAASMAECPEYRLGYLCGMIRGDGTIGSYSYDGRRRARERQDHFRLALVDFEALERARRYLWEHDLSTQEFVFQKAAAGYRPVRAIRTSARLQVERIREL